MMMGGRGSLREMRVWNRDETEMKGMKFLYEV